MRRSTSGSHHSRPLPPGRSSPRTRAPGSLELGQRRPEVDPVARPHLGRGERPVGGGVAAGDPQQRVGDVLEEGRREPARRRGAERVAVQAGIARRRSSAPRPASRIRTARRSLLELGQHAPRVEALEHALAALGVVQVPHRAQDVVELVLAGGLAKLGAELQVVLDLGQGGRVDQIAELLLTQQLAQQVAVEREGGRATLGVRRVALVHVGGDVVEEQRGGERRGGLGLHLDERDLAAVELGQEVDQPGQVEDVAQALAVGLEDDREVVVLLGHLEQRLGLEPLLPERRALAGTSAGDQQSPGGVLSEAGAEQSRAGELGHDPVLELVGFDQHEVDVRRLLGVGQVDDDPVV